MYNPDFEAYEASQIIPDFGPEARAAVESARAEFPGTFGLIGHVGLFRIAPRASYVSRGQVVLYTQQQWTAERFGSVYGRAPHDAEELWCDFAKGSVAELRGQLARAR